MKTVFLTFISLFIFISCNNPKIKIDPSETTEITYSDSSDSVVKIGVAAMLTPHETLPIYDAVIKYIGEKMNIEVEMIFTKDYNSMNNMVKDKKVLAAFVCSGAYVTGHDDWGMELIVAPMHNGETNYYSNIIINIQSDFEKFADLKDSKFAFTDPVSNTGKLVPCYELAKNSKTPEEFFSEIIYSGSHDNSIEAVAKKIVDGAAVDNLIWDYMVSNNSSLTDKTKVIDQFGPFCSPPVVTHPDLDISIKNKLENILLEMHNDIQGKEILNKLLIDRFIVVQDSCYASIRSMQKWVDNN